jgi:hypothetical protein
MPSPSHKPMYRSHCKCSKSNGSPRASSSLGFKAESVPISCTQPRLESSGRPRDSRESRTSDSIVFDIFQPPPPLGLWRRTANGHATVVGPDELDGAQKRLKDVRGVALPRGDRRLIFVLRVWGCLFVLQTSDICSDTLKIGVTGHSHAKECWQYICEASKEAAIVSLVDQSYEIQNLDIRLKNVQSTHDLSFVSIQLK